MTEVKNTLPTISIKWKDYVLVKDRVLFFNQECPNGCIRTERLSEWEMEIFKATVIPDCDKPERYFTWYSQAKRSEGLINKTSAMENCESSAVGRALAMMWIGIIESIASADEMVKAGVKPEWKNKKLKKKSLNKKLKLNEQLSLIEKVYLGLINQNWKC